MIPAGSSFLVTAISSEKSPAHSPLLHLCFAEIEIFSSQSWQNFLGHFWASGHFTFMTVDEGGGPVGNG